jgi:hypothetical protein
MLEEAIHYPRADEGWVRTVVIGSVLTLLGFLLIPAILVFGYYMRVMRSTISGDGTPPEFDEWSDLFVDGLKGFAVTLVYMLVPAIVFGVTVGGFLTATVAGDGNVGFGAVLGALAGFAVSAVIALLFWYVVPAAVANVARTGKVGSGFAFEELRPALMSGVYAVPWALSVAVLVATGILTGLLNVVPLVGFLLAMPVTFYATVVAFRLAATGFGNATEAVVERPEEPSGRPMV